MYAIGRVMINRPNVWMIPASSLVLDGEKSFCWSYDNGKAVKVQAQTGISDGKWIEVTDRSQPQTGEDAPWTPINGSEKVIVSDLSVITEGATVKVEE